MPTRLAREAKPLAAGSRPPGHRARRSGVHGLLALDDRVRARRRSSHNGEHEHESRTADHAAAFAGRGADPSRALLERFHRPGSLGPQAARRARGSPRPTPCPVRWSSSSSFSASSARSRSSTSASCSRPALVQRTELVVSGGHGRLAQERPRHVDGAGGGEQPTEQQRPRRCAHAFAATARS